MVGEVEFLYEGRVRVDKIGGYYRVMFSKDGLSIRMCSFKTKEEKDIFVKNIENIIIPLSPPLEEIFKTHYSS